MSTLNDIKKLASDCPNDSDLGYEVRSYIDNHRTCCDNPDNIEGFGEQNVGHGKWDISGTKCKICGTILTSKIDRL